MPPSKTIPLILLPECVLFPHALVPLYIFEPRYRAMLRYALTRERFFSIGTLKVSDGGPLNEDDENIHEFSCAGMVRASVGQRDGTSRLILQGVGRIRFAEWLQREPFRIARVEPVPSRVKNVHGAGRLARRVIAVAREIHDGNASLPVAYDQRFGGVKDPELVADVIGFNFLRDVGTKIPLLGMSPVEQRLEYVLEKLEARPAI
jgi:Lon protease-like protein